MNKTKIEWADKTWNPITGCTPISEACNNCYAHSIAKRFWGFRKFSDIRLHEDRSMQPTLVSKPSRIFVGSMTDMFHENILFQVLDTVLNVVDMCPQHTFMFLTKRPKNMANYFTKHRNFIPKNVWLGVTAENQKRWDERVPVLNSIGECVKFASCEPLLGSINGIDRYSLDWIIVGKETGRNARPMLDSWARSIKDQCNPKTTKFFFKNDGELGIFKEIPNVNIPS